MHRRISTPSILFFALVIQLYSANVITWVPPYSIGPCKNTLQADYGGIGMKDGLTHLALQFWVPDGANVRTIRSYGTITDEDIIWFRDWGHSHGIRVMLCIFNAESGWDWNAGINSFVNNQDAFVSSILSEIDRLELDGAEVDIEGPGAGNENQADFLSFCTKLSDALHPLGKHVTVASFAYVWNAPNSDWWPGLMEVTDGITTMGYNEIGRNADGWASYAGQKGLASDPSKLMIGMMGGTDSWQGNDALEQIDWVLEDGECGIGIWDAALGSGLWESAEVWQKLAAIKGSGETRTVSSAQIRPGSGLSLMNNPGNNRFVTSTDLKGRVHSSNYITSANSEPISFRHGTVIFRVPVSN